MPLMNVLYVLLDFFYFCMLYMLINFFMMICFIINNMVFFSGMGSGEFISFNSWNVVISVLLDWMSLLFMMFVSSSVIFMESYM